MDWSGGLAASLLGSMNYLAADMRRPDGLASNAIASATFNDRVLRTILVAVPHERSGHLARGGDASAPASVLRALRLDPAHDALRRDGDVPVGEVARRFGFTNAGRFAAAYARRFGEHPSDTVRPRRR